MFSILKGKARSVGSASSCKLRLLKRVVKYLDWRCEGVGSATWTADQRHLSQHRDDTGPPGEQARFRQRCPNTAQSAFEEHFQNITCPPPQGTCVHKAPCKCTTLSYASSRVQIFEKFLLFLFLT